MGLSKEDVQEIVQLLDDLKASELHVRTRHVTLWLRRDGEGWSQPVPAGTPDEERAEEVPGLVSVRTPMAAPSTGRPSPVRRRTSRSAARSRRRRWSASSRR